MSILTRVGGKEVGKWVSLLSRSCICMRLPPGEALSTGKKDQGVQVFKGAQFGHQNSVQCPALQKVTCLGKGRRQSCFLFLLLISVADWRKSLVCVLHQCRKILTSLASWLIS